MKGKFFNGIIYLRNKLSQIFLKLKNRCHFLQIFQVVLIIKITKRTIRFKKKSCKKLRESSLNLMVTNIIIFLKTISKEEAKKPLFSNYFCKSAFLLFLHIFDLLNSPNSSLRSHWSLLKISKRSWRASKRVRQIEEKGNRSCDWRSLWKSYYRNIWI